MTFIMAMQAVLVVALAASAGLGVLLVRSACRAPEPPLRLLVARRARREP